MRKWKLGERERVKNRNDEWNENEGLKGQTFTKEESKKDKGI